MAQRPEKTQGIQSETPPLVEKFQLTVMEHLETSDKKHLIYTFCLLTFVMVLQCKQLHFPPWEVVPLPQWTQQHIHTLHQIAQQQPQASSAQISKSREHNADLSRFSDGLHAFSRTGQDSQTAEQLSQEVSPGKPSLVQPGPCSPTPTSPVTPGAAPSPAQHHLQ